MPQFGHICDEDFELYLFGRLQQARVRLLEAHLAECTLCVAQLGRMDGSLCDSARLSTIKTRRQGEEKRREYRFIANEAAVLQVLNPFSTAHLDGRILDISRNGVKFSTSKVVPPGSLVKLRRKDDVAFGDTQYCSQANNDYFVGIQLHEYFPRNLLAGSH